MCVETIENAEIQEKVVGYKIFEVDKKGRLNGLVFRSTFVYERGRTYKSYSGPGFQAFVSRADAISVAKKWGTKTRVVRVFLFKAKRGVVQEMSFEADGKLGWIAPEMIIPKAKK